MATFQKKYYYTFSDITNKRFTTELWQYTGATLTAQEIKADDNPFTVTYSPTNNKFEVVRGSGCDMNVVSVTGLSFINMYTSDMMDYQIRFNSGSSLLWVGYLNSELYTEPFSEYNNYTVSLTGNDGLALLERMDYLTSGSTVYFGYVNNWTIITNILQKLNITWNAVYVGLSTTSTEITLNSGNTVISATYSNNENFYDEDGNPMNCREVLETILAPFSAYIQIINANIYITDVNTMAQANNQTFRRYNGTTFAYETNVTLNLALGDVSTIDFASNSQTLNILAPINKQKVIYSPYIVNTLIDYDPTKETFSGFSFGFNNGTGPFGEYSNTWTENLYNASNYWNCTYSGLPLYGLFAKLIGTGTNEGNNDTYLVTNYSGLTANTFVYKPELLPKVVTNYIQTPSTNSTLPTNSYYSVWYATGVPNDCNGAVGQTYYSYYANMNSPLNISNFYTNTGLTSVFIPASSGNIGYTDIPIGMPKYLAYISTAGGGISANTYCSTSIANSFTYFLKIEAKGYIRTTDGMNETPTTSINRVLCYTNLMIGNKRWGGFTPANGGDWYDSGLTSYYFTWNFCDKTQTGGVWTTNTIADKWIDLNNSSDYSSGYAKPSSVIIPLFGFVGNTISFSINGFTAYNGKVGSEVPVKIGAHGTTNTIRDFRLKDIKFSILDSNYNDVTNNDIEYWSYINKNAKDDGDDVKLKYGTNTTLCPIERGSILGYSSGSYFFPQFFIRSGTTDIVENLLARSIVSNYTSKMIEIQCLINRIENIFGTLTYNNYWSGFIFGIQGAVIDYHEATIDLTLQQLEDDSLTISKNYT